MTQKMTSDEAKTFSRVSTGNAMILMATARSRGCTCEPYTDWFTFRRWLAQGYHVKKGEHGVKLGIIISEEQTKTVDGEETKMQHNRPWMTTVFCKHQVEKNK